jgi:hypothetical protein
MTVPRKPASAWLLQLFAAAGSLLFIVGLTRLTRFLINNQHLMDQMAFHVIWRLFAFALGIVVVFVIQKRSVYARASGLAYLSLVLILAIDSMSLDMQAVGPKFF